MSAGELTLENVLGDSVLVWVLPALTSNVVDVEQGGVVTGVGRVVFSSLSDVGNPAGELCHGKYDRGGVGFCQFFYFKSIAMCSPASALKGRIIDLDPEDDLSKQNFDAYLT